MNEALALPASRIRLGAGRISSDERLLQRAAAGDERAFAAIFRRYHQDLFRYCRAILGDPEDAQDALQNTMLKALRALPGEKREIKLKPWLYRISHNEAIEILRRRRPVVALNPEMAAAIEAGPDQQTETQERLRQLIFDLGELPERQRSALVLRELSDMSFEEIGATLGTTPAVIRQTIYEGRVNLQQMGEGREMSCESVKQALSDGDGRVLRRRNLRAHLRACASCAEFKAGIATRRRDLALIGPLPAAASAGLLHALLGAGHGGTGAGGLAGILGGGAGKAVATSTLLKSAAAVVVATAVGVTAAGTTGLVHLGSGGQGAGAPAQSSSPAQAVSGYSDHAGTPSGTSGNQSASGNRSAAESAHIRREANALDGQISKKGHSASGGSAEAAPSDQPRASSDASATAGSNGANGALPTAASHGQETAAAHQPHLTAAARKHPTPASHPSHPVTPGSSASHSSPVHPTPPSPPGASHSAEHPTRPAHPAPGPGH